MEKSHPIRDFIISFKRADAPRITVRCHPKLYFRFSSFKNSKRNENIMPGFRTPQAQGIFQKIANVNNWVYFTRFNPLFEEETLKQHLVTEYRTKSRAKMQACASTMNRLILLEILTCKWSTMQLLLWLRSLTLMWLQRMIALRVWRYEAKRSSVPFKRMPDFSIPERHWIFEQPALLSFGF